MKYATLSEMKKANIDSGGCFFDKSHAVLDKSMHQYKNYIITERENGFYINKFNEKNGRVGVAFHHASTLEDAIEFINQI